MQNANSAQSSKIKRTKQHPESWCPVPTKNKPSAHPPKETKQNCSLIFNSKDLCNRWSGWVLHFGGTHQWPATERLLCASPWARHHMTAHWVIKRKQQNNHYEVGVWSLCFTMRKRNLRTRLRCLLTLSLKALGFQTEQSARQQTCSQPRTEWAEAAGRASLHQLLGGTNAPRFVPEVPQQVAGPGWLHHSGIVPPSPPRPGLPRGGCFTQPIQVTLICRGLLPILSFCWGMAEGLLSGSVE